jgi:CRP-like cAMP-binding protein
MIAIMSDPVAALFDGQPRRSLAAGAVLFRAADPVREVALVCTGRIDLVRHTGTGAALVLQRAAPGAVVAEASVYAAAYHCDAVAVDATTLAVLPVAAFRHGLSAPVAAAAWGARLARAVQAARLRAEIRTLRTVAERLEAWIEAGGSIPDRGDWQGLAADLGVSREALYREFARRRGRADQDRLATIARAPRAASSA